MNQITGTRTPPRRPSFTRTQGQYLAFIQAYSLVNGRPPAEADMQRFFGVTPPSVHQMVLGLERAGLIGRTPNTPRSIEIIVDPNDVPPLQPTPHQLVKSSAQGY